VAIIYKDEIFWDAHFLAKTKILSVTVAQPKKFLQFKLELVMHILYSYRSALIGFAKAASFSFVALVRPAFSSQRSALAACSAASTTRLAKVATTNPMKKQVEGRFGPREMYIVETVENGLVFVSPMQLVAIARAFDGKYDSAVTVEL